LLFFFGSENDFSSTYLSCPFSFNIFFSRPLAWTPSPAQVVSYYYSFLRLLVIFDTRAFSANAYLPALSSFFQRPLVLVYCFFPPARYLSESCTSLLGFPAETTRQSQFHSFPSYDFKAGASWVGGSTARVLLGRLGYFHLFPHAGAFGRHIGFLIFFCACRGGCLCLSCSARQTRAVVAAPVV